MHIWYHMWFRPGDTSARNSQVGLPHSGELAKDFFRYARPEIGVRFQNSLDIEQILPAFSSTPLGIGCRPDFTLQHVFERGDRKLQSEHFANCGSFNELAVTRVDLDLNTEVGSERRDAQAVLKFFCVKASLHQLSGLIDLVDSHGQVEIETDQRLDIGVDALAADHAEMNPAIPEQGQ